MGKALGDRYQLRLYASGLEGFTRDPGRGQLYTIHSGCYTVSSLRAAKYTAWRKFLREECPLHEC